MPEESHIVEDPQEGKPKDESSTSAATAPDAPAEEQPLSKKEAKKKAKVDEILNEPLKKADKDLIEQVMKANPSLTSGAEDMSQKKLEEMLRGLKLEDIMTGMAPGGKNKKDMASHKFWQTQPVAKWGEEITEDGEIKKGVLEEVPKEPLPLLDNFEWVVMDLTDDKELDEVYELLTGHYVEDDEAMFRFNYSGSFLNWALKAPGWRREWHIGVRVKASRKLVAFISGIPIQLRVRERVLSCSEINFLCIHKKLRSKRLAPLLIKEITRRCNEVEIWQAIYTAGVVLPKPVASCRYYHRSLDWLKLHEVGFSPLPPKSTKARQITRFALPKDTATAGLRGMKKEDVKPVLDLLKRYLERFEMAPVFTEEEIEHWFLHKEIEGTSHTERVIWAYVVEDPETKKITDFFSFYSLESSVIKNVKHDMVRAAYMFYYASESAFATGKSKDDGKKILKARLNALVHDALILAKRFNFDVFNALTLLDNTLFLQDQKFGAGDGQLHFYIYNYRVAPIRGGMDEKRGVDEKNGSGIGVVML